MKSWDKFYLKNEGNKYADNFLVSAVLRKYKNLNLSQKKKNKYIRFRIRR
jgi:hypothetical protein